MKRFGMQSCFFALAVYTVIPCWAQTEWDNYKELTGSAPKGFGVGFRITTTPKHMLGTVMFNNVPVELRTVPSNQYGPLAKGVPVTVPDSVYEVNDLKASSLEMLSFYGQYTLSRFTFRGGYVLPQLGVITQTLPMIDLLASPNNRKGVNQNGTSARGYGTSLVYYSIYWDPDFTGGAKPFGEIEFRVNRFFSVVAGYAKAKKTATLSLENGYDQFDQLTAYSKREGIGEVSVSTPAPYFLGKFTVFGPYGAFVFGAQPISTQISSIGDTMSPGFAIGRDIKFVMGIEFTLTQVKKPKN